MVVAARGNITDNSIVQRDMTKPVLTRIVACGTCRLGCVQDAIVLHPECGDDPGQYETVEWLGCLILKHKPNGECVYLAPGGCSIYERRPAICREFDCADLINRHSRHTVQRMIANNIISRPVVKQARKLLVRRRNDEKSS